MPAGVITAVDADALACYCEAVVRYRQAASLLARSAPLIRGARSGDLIANSLDRVTRGWADQIRLFARELGLTPSARAGLHMEISPLTPSTSGSWSRAPRSWVSASPRRPTRTVGAAPKRLLWRARQDSNLRPSAPEADALSAELQAHDAHAPGISAERSSPSHDVNGPNDTRSASGRPHGADPDGPGRPGRLRADHRKTQGASAMAEADVDDHPSPNPGRCSLASRATGVPFANRPPRGRGRSSSLDRAIQPGAAVSETAVPSFPDTTGSRRRAASSESRVICRPGMAPNAGNVEAAPEGAASMLSR